jgi:site-specific recombinase XerD
VANCRFANDQRHGQHLQTLVTIQRQHRALLDSWLAARGETSEPLFPTRTGNALNCKDAYAILQRMARQANAHLPPEEHIHVSLHVLRHAFLR